MLEFGIDLTNLIAAVKNAEADTGKCDLIETEGEQYVLDYVFKRFLNNEKVMVSEIDFDAFDEDDITLMIDNKLKDIENVVRGGEKLAEFFTKAPPVTSMARRFF